MMRSRYALCALTLLIAGCSFGAPRTLPAVQGDSILQQMSQTGAGKIKHIVWIVQENRSFDNLFQGYPGADTVSTK